MLTSCTLASGTSSSRPGANRGQASPVKAKVVRTELDRPSLPAHLPRQNVRFDVEGQACPLLWWRAASDREMVSERLDHVPARLRVIRICRPYHPPSHLRQNGRSPKAWLPRPCSPTHWFPRSLASLQAKPDLRPAGRRGRSVHPGELGRRCLLVAGATAAKARRPRLRITKAIADCRRHPGPGAGFWRGPH
jgi:hypothetical protein